MRAVGVYGTVKRTSIYVTLFDLGCNKLLLKRQTQIETHDHDAEKRPFFD
jgi:hypothetical protein